mmetsp:Transcript_42943/g.96532  ORF Transcript_42943/g.96532 Transcript_42943/m.96532 type:complete len:226 (-) Transcript_42943:262-939(-)
MLLLLQHHNHLRQRMDSPAKPARKHRLQVDILARRHQPPTSPLRCSMRHLGNLVGSTLPHTTLLGPTVHHSPLLPSSHHDRLPWTSSLSCSSSPSCPLRQAARSGRSSPFCPSSSPSLAQAAEAVVAPHGPLTSSPSSPSCPSFHHHLNPRLHHVLSASRVHPLPSARTSSPRTWLGSIFSVFWRRRCRCGHRPSSQHWLCSARSQEHHVRSMPWPLRFPRHGLW